MYSVYLLLVPVLASAITDAVKWNIQFIPPDLRVAIDEVARVHVIIENSTVDVTLTEKTTIKLHSERSNLASVDDFVSYVETFDNGSWHGQFNVTGVFLGNYFFFVKELKSS
jgi:hypothetical protein